MADELLRSKHVFGSKKNLLAAIESGKVDSFDILFLMDENDVPVIGWLNRDGEPVFLEDESRECVVEVDELPETGEAGVIYIYGEDGYFYDGEQFVNLCKPTDVTQLEASIKVLESLVEKKANIEDVNAQIVEAIAESEGYTDKAIEGVLDEIKHSYEKVRYEISHKPNGTLVDYREKEIRVMCPVDTQWTKQEVGGTGNPNMHYMGFKAYAPEGAVSFKEGDKGVIVDEMFTFDNDFAGTDEYGRNYSIVWLALASYDEASGTWTYFGKNSSTEKYVGWTYCVEWYDENGVVIESDSIRINLSNEECHSAIEPYYVHNITKEVEEKIETVKSEVKTYTDEQIATIMSMFTIVEI